ncbi:hypothetical protein SELR_08110 [Selenomonas ruminantium subsp. lactilytica TAM6421]|uniref:Uncharacterized protein n=1 Tax=Selenomonas ruminantium subsp. lactilytica (strain NBRC 103574 / TAM6421) TaxID=927704 RepID=I0GP32_SELRL|nr:hypothetical protein [Selenomonas ruminantium]BAL82519.1 hypothetical protein SELR_08110 [Selenomonas ruminantium subsp. lactilytica TAM6421]
MGFRLQVTGADTISLDENMIRTAETELYTPEDSRARASKSLSTIVVTGKLYAAAEGNETMKLFNWAHVPAESEQAYRDVMLTVVFAGKTFRQVHLSKAFVVDYKESYEDTEGFGTFRLVVRQKTDLVDKVTAGSTGAGGAFAAVGGGFGGALGSAMGGAVSGMGGNIISAAMPQNGCFGDIGNVTSSGQIMGQIAKQAAQVEVIKQAEKISPLAGQAAQITTMAGNAVQQAQKQAQKVVTNGTMNIDDFIMH